MKGIGIKFLNLSLIIVLLFSSITVFAVDGDRDVSTILSEESLQVSSDRGSIEGILDEASEEIKDILKIEKAPYFQVESFIKIYNLQDSDIVKHYKENKEFKKNILDEYRWVAPAFQDDNKTLLVNFIKKNEGEGWSMAGFSDGLATEGYSFLLDKEKIIELLEDNGIKNIDEMKFVRTDLYVTNIIYINMDNKEFAIPFSNNAEVLGFENGKLYNIDKLMNQIAEKYTPYDVEASSKDVAMKEGSNKDKVIIASIKIIFVGIAIVSIGLLIIVNKKNLKSNKQ